MMAIGILLVFIGWFIVISIGSPPHSIHISKGDYFGVFITLIGVILFIISILIWVWRHFP